MDWGIVWSVVVGIAIFSVGIAMVGATLVWLIVRKIKKGAQTGASKKFSFPCAAFFGGKTEAAAK